MVTPQPTEPTPGEDDRHRLPRWVNGFIIAAVAAVALVVVLLATGSGDHGPSRHLPGGEGTIEMPEGHTPPVDHG